MQKWCPEQLTKAVEGPPEFASMPSDAPVSGSVSAHAVFRPESGFATGENLLRSLSREERAEVVTLIEQDLRREFELRRREDEAAREAQAAAEREALAAWQESLPMQVNEALRTAMHQLARRTSEYAMLMAAKVIRREVELDPEILARSLETILYKCEAGCTLSVTVHPDDAAWLAAAPDFRERCRIKDVKEDRRLDRGGCLVKVDESEWDATVSRQLAALAEALDTALLMPPANAESSEHA